MRPSEVIYSKIDKQTNAIISQELTIVNKRR